MLQAKLKSGKTFIPALLSESELIQLKQQKKDFYCPVCKEKVILRAGKKVTPHFSHYKNTACKAGRGGEGAYHERGKLLLYQWMKEQGIEVTLEHYLPEINQRPDLYLKVNEHRIAMEYQCSRISSDTILERTKGYQEAGIRVIWILGERLLKRKGSNKLLIDSYTQAMMHQFSFDYPLSLFYFCPLTSKVIKFQDIVFTQQTKAFGKITIRSLHELTFSHFLASHYLSKRAFFQQWKMEIERFRLRQRKRAHGKELKWQRWLYQNGLSIEQLSSLAHLPVRNAYRIKLPLWNWQSRILYGVIAPKRLEALIHLKECKRIVDHERIPMDDFPLIQSSCEPVYEYLILLSSLEILEQTGETSFIKKQPIPIHKQLGDAFQEDIHLLENLLLKKQP